MDSLSKQKNWTPKIVRSPIQITQETHLACAQFGIFSQWDRSKSNNAHTIQPNEETLSKIQSSRITLIHGPSGSGKSSLIRGLIESFKDAPFSIHQVDPIESIQDPNLTTRSLFDLFEGPISDRYHALAVSGLAQPRIWSLPISSLSLGEQSRAKLALQIHRAQSGDYIIVDELCSLLDRLCAQSVARSFSKFARSKGVSLIAASAHEDMESFLNPDLIINASDQSVQTPDRDPSDTQPLFTIEEGSFSDYKSLAHFHYLGHKPATHTRILRAIRAHPLGDRHKPILAGVLVVSMPTLNSSWRDRAWPGFFTKGSKRENARQINTHLRCLSRMIVHPQSRGLGISSALVRAYLQNPDTLATEGIAAMGLVSPFLARSGMNEYPLEYSIVDLRLIDALAHEKIEIDQILNHSIKPGSLIAQELIRWGKAKKLVDRSIDEHESIRILTPIAACKLLAQPRAYAHTYLGGSSRDEEHLQHRE